MTRIDGRTRDMSSESESGSVRRPCEVTPAIEIVPNRGNITGDSQASKESGAAIPMA